MVVSNLLNQSTLMRCPSYGRTAAKPFLLFVLSCSFMRSTATQVEYRVEVFRTILRSSFLPAMNVSPVESRKMPNPQVQVVARFRFSVSGHCCFSTPSFPSLNFAQSIQTARHEKPLVFRKRNCTCQVAFLRRPIHQIVVRCISSRDERRIIGKVEFLSLMNLIFELGHNSVWPKKLYSVGHDVSFVVASQPRPV